MRDPLCGPGYESRSGILPRLCFHIDWSNSLPGSAFEDTLCVSQCDALAFAETQPDLSTSTPQ
ncbi:MAG TPA: hypothetical protein VMD59_01305 [Acidimicrobiales bacterium]|nr:hypothetical protein [Acidimicrobiales bacterium]